MEYLPGIFKGLMTTLFISMVTLLAAAVPGTLLFWGKKSKSKILFLLSTVYIELFEGIPLLAQLFFIYYALPLISRDLSFSPAKTAIIVLSVNAAAHIASLANTESKSLKIALNFTGYMKVAFLSCTLEFGRIIKYTSLLSIIGLTELLRSTNTIMFSNSKVETLIAAIILYLGMSVTVKLIYTGLKKVFFDKGILV